MSKMDISYKELSFLRDLLKDKKQEHITNKIDLKLRVFPGMSIKEISEFSQEVCNGEFLEEATEDEKSCFSLLEKLNKIEETLKQELR